MLVLFLVFACGPTTCDTLYYDHDGDGYGHPDVVNAGCESGAGWVSEVDCGEYDTTRHPGADEVCNDVDDDCDGDVDEDAIDAVSWYADGDGDDYGDDADVVAECGAPDGYVARGGDCFPDESTLNPDADETCNDVDDDCDGVVDDDAQGPNYTAETAAAVLGDDATVEVTGAFGDGEDEDWLGVQATDDFDVDFFDDFFVYAEVKSLDPGVHVDLALFRHGVLVTEIVDAQIGQWVGYEGRIDDADGGLYLVRVKRTAGGSCEDGYVLELGNRG